MPDQDQNARPPRRSQWVGYGALLAVILLGAVYSLAVFGTIRDQAMDENLEANLVQAETASRFISEQQEGLLNLLGVIATRDRLRRALAASQTSDLVSFLQPVLTMGPQTNSVFLVGPEGRYLARVPKVGEDVKLPPAGVMPPAPWVSGLEPGRCGPVGPCLVLSVPVMTQEGKIAAYLGVTQPPAFWKNFFSQMAARPGRTFFLFDQEGRVLATGLAKAERPAGALEDMAAQVRRHLAPKRRHWAGVARLPGGGEQVFAAAASVPASGWSVVVMHDYQTAMAPNRAMFRNIFLFLALLLCCLIFLGALLFTRYRAQERRLVSIKGEARHLEALVAERTADLEVSTQRYLSLVQDLPDVVFELDQDGRYTFVSRAVEGVLGYQPGEMLGRSQREFVLPQDRPKYDQHRARTEQDEPMSILALRHQTADGRVRWLSIHSRGLSDARGRSLGRRGVARDVTQQVLAERRVRELSGQLINAQEEERKRLALDLHDEMGQLLSALKIGLQTLARTHEEVRPDLDRLIRLTQEVMDRSRSLAYRLRPAILDNFGLTAALTDLCESLSEDGVLAVTTHLDKIDDRALGPAVKTTLFRFVQEALTNVIKHSQSSKAEVSLSSRDGLIRAEVRDFGRGFDVEKILEQGGGSRLGLLGMHERLNLIGGRLTIKTSTQGTVLVAEVHSGGQA
ncbi:MAG: PAS domain S-box protein [Deltaproteobacteria bacterium]|nr:PAS domain S-box protein [Deltaproteobacteria bacterium]